MASRNATSTVLRSSHLASLFHPTGASSSSIRLACSSPSFRPSPRNCHRCPLFATCRSHHSLPPSRPALQSSRIRTLATAAATQPHRAQPGPSTPTGPVPEISVASSDAAVPGKDIKGKGKAEDHVGKVQAKTRTPALKPRKQVITLTNAAIEHLAELLKLPEPKLIRVGVKNKGCAGMSYHLEYVDSPGKFDEVVTAPLPAQPATGGDAGQVKVVVDSRALFSIIGSEMDWEEGRMGSRFTFKNPNIKEACGCGESFMT